MKALGSERAHPPSGLRGSQQASFTGGDKPRPFSKGATTCVFPGLEHAVRPVQGSRNRPHGPRRTGPGSSPTGLRAGYNHRTGRTEGPLRRFAAAGSGNAPLGGWARPAAARIPRSGKPMSSLHPRSRGRCGKKFFHGAAAAAGTRDRLVLSENQMLRHLTALGAHVFVNGHDAPSRPLNGRSRRRDDGRRRSNPRKTLEACPAATGPGCLLRILPWPGKR